LKENLSDATSGMSLMAAIKRASPSKGDISLLVVEQALTYALAGDSVITVPHWFKYLSMTC